MMQIAERRRRPERRLGHPFRKSVPKRGRGGIGSRGGFTLVEAVVALTLLGVILSALLPSFVQNLRFNSDSELRTGAVAVAQQEMDRLRGNASWPTTGSSWDVDTELTTYEATLTWGPWCQGGTCFDGAREVEVLVTHEGRDMYRVSTVFTALDGSGET